MHKRVKLTESQRGVVVARAGAGMGLADGGENVSVMPAESARGSATHTVNAAGDAAPAPLRGWIS